MDYLLFFTTNNDSGWKCRKDRLKNKHPEIYNEILLFLENNQDLIDLPFKQQIYHFIHNITEKQQCKECYTNNIKFFDISRGYQQFCSLKCSNKNKNKIKKTKQTNIEKYGVINPMLNPEIKEKIKEKNLKNFDSENPFGSKKIQDKIKKTNKDKYGVEVASKSDRVKEKYKETCIKKYNVETHWFDPEFKRKVKEKIVEKFGVDNVFKNGEVITKIKQTNLERYDTDIPSKNVDIKNKIKQTNFNRYGDECILRLKKVKDKIKRTNLDKYGTECIFKSKDFRKKYLTKTSKIEKTICKTLGGKKFNYHGKEFDIIIGNNIYEIDGDFFHPINLNNLTLIQLNSVINDYEKIKIIKKSKYNLYKIHVSTIPKKYNEKTLQKLSYVPDYNITPNQKIISKEYLKQYINNRGKDNLRKYVKLFLKFIRTFHPDFPDKIYNEEFGPMYNTLQKYENDTIYDSKNKSFRNTCSSLGCGYLKNNFKSYWKSKYKKHMTPLEIWYDDDIMTKIISYRIGINTSGEVFDFSIKELVKGISAIRGTISFFKPVLAASIYQHYLGEIENPIVLDPCSGFGGRLLGFKSKYPNGQYIGVEPNTETYNELIDLGSKFNGVSLYNSKFEDFDSEINYDIIFTSIPYFDLELYSNNFEYGSFDNWVNSFIKSLLSRPKLIINMSYDLCKELGLIKYIDSYIINNTSHYNKKQITKKEVIIKMNF